MSEQPLTDQPSNTVRADLRFLDCPARTQKPRRVGITHILDRGTPLRALDDYLSEAAHLIDILKVGWGIGYIDRTLRDRAVLCANAGITLCIGGTLFEVAVVQDRVIEYCRWADRNNVRAIEVSNGIKWISPGQKTALIKNLSRHFIVFAETGAKFSGSAPGAPDWIDEMQGDLEAGARWVIAEGRESGSVGIYDKDHSVRAGLVDQIIANIPREQIIFETPRKDQQAWFVNKIGANANLGNIAVNDVLGVETLRLGLRADTAATFWENAMTADARRSADNI